MPMLKVDSEAAELTVTAVEMLRAALSARVRRADPQQVISNSLTLQANKLESVTAQLLGGEPPTWAEMSTPMQQQVVRLAQQLAMNKDPAHRAAILEMLREILTATETPNGQLSLAAPLQGAEG